MQNMYVCYIIYIEKLTFVQRNREKGGFPPSCYDLIISDHYIKKLFCVPLNSV